MAIVPISGRKPQLAASARDAITHIHLELVTAIARRCKLRLPPSFDLDDLIAVGNIALLKAAAEYNPAAHNDTPFRLYAHKIIRGAILDSARRRNYDANTMPSIDDVPEERTARDNVIEMEIDGGRLRRRVRAAIAELPEAERELVTRLYIEGEASLPQIEHKLRRCSTAATRALHESAIAALRDKLAA